MIYCGNSSSTFSQGWTEIFNLVKFIVPERLYLIKNAINANEYQIFVILETFPSDFKKKCEEEEF